MTLHRQISWLIFLTREDYLRPFFERVVPSLIAYCFPLASLLMIDQKFSVRLMPVKTAGQFH